MARLWYPRRFHVQIIAPTLAEHLFSDYSSPMPPFQFHGGERHGGALLESALALPRQTFGGRYLYKTWDAKAGVLLRSLIKNHPLVDGNKRIAVATTLVFLLMNGRFLVAPNEEMVRFALAVAASEPDMRWRALARWIRSKTHKVSDLQSVFAEVKARHPNLAADFDDVALRMEEVFGQWVQKQRELERRVRRFCRLYGVSVDEFWAEALRRMV